MKISVHYFLIALVSVLALSCGKKDTKAKRKFQVITDGSSASYRQGEEINLKIKFIDSDHATPETIKLFINNELVEEYADQLSFSLNTSDWKLGDKSIQFKVKFEDGKTYTAGRNLKLLSNQKVENLKYTIINTYPHDIEAYTQGLEFSSSGVLYESTGEYGESTIRKVNYKTGEVEKQTALSNRFFGEGMTLFSNQIYQLTWREMACLVYNKHDLEQQKVMPYAMQREGWGLCNNGEEFIMSDGTNQIFFLDPLTLQEKRRIQVFDYDGEVELLNELEYINGKIFANVYTTDLIMVIDPQSGLVEAKLNMEGILKPEDKHAEIDVLNGIAYRPSTETLFITGKNWPKLYELKIDGDLLSSQ